MMMINDFGDCFSKGEREKRRLMMSMRSVEEKGKRNQKQKKSKIFSPKSKVNKK